MQQIVVFCVLCVVACATGFSVSGSFGIGNKSISAQGGISLLPGLLASRASSADEKSNPIRSPISSLIDFFNNLGLPNNKQNEPLNRPTRPPHLRPTTVAPSSAATASNSQSSSDDDQSSSQNSAEADQPELPSSNEADQSDDSSPNEADQSDASSPNEADQSGSSTSPNLPNLNGSSSSRRPRQLTLPSFDDFLSGIKNLSNQALPDLSSLPRIPGLSDALEHARDMAQSAIGIGENLSNGIQETVRRALDSNEPQEAINQLVNTIRDAYTQAAENCPIIGVGRLVLEEGQRIISQIAEAVRNIDVNGGITVNV